jgi:glycosyltransferase involved in cell wall biosynthesis
MIHQHAEALASTGLECFVFQPGFEEERPKWFESRARFRTSRNFNPGQDFLVIPEVWAGQFGTQCREQGIKYAIFVQGWHLIREANKVCTLADIDNAYKDASLILCISDETAAMIALTYPEIPAERIVRVVPSVSEKFAPGPKSKAISYMPRKLPNHAKQVCELLEPRLPQDWQIESIHNLDETGVARALAHSCIFLSFSDLEGLGLPPLEAAMSGALVVGYTGQGGKEYFKAPNFRKIEHGDLRSLFEETLRAVEDVNAGLLESPEFTMGTASLKLRYSRESELESLLTFARHVQQLCS